ncbi:UDP-N-acetylmuramoyl-L-alanyl-D-glutamate--2, 6-diaminopimelate ligase [Methylacidimicrobium cyclopophantes]|uniref:UDP-N-acetylmuramoyl-L-alanyl-D-glutamate--2,6-diaminopimelate ligase n=1 Tax=Methylacidimicrobium cyclopophantes TaxID=1041766 RepID=A0A5E6M988_9BACT|nr:UDP-N-acetylmuramoyl-L-alanyl-D-glutamate--2,6-diaminopimelate ligase [Methylacidimicrobium cyclopophantes]VVM05768.1 UDP-N-acetylmuramoyl-L-alanyl-D-glutamate--2, 6-diaminopimelate ligase [Methylacidimicrobium cyclopophantes]
MTLRDLLAAVEPCEVTGDADPPVRGLCYDSRSAKPGDLFFAWQGVRVDGHRFLSEAVGKGVVAIVGERGREAASPLRVPYVRVANAREALALMADRFYRHPSGSMELVGITGTNGKTTTAFLVHHILERSGRKTGLIGTVRYQLGELVLPARRTTPEGSDLQRLLAEMRESGCRNAVLEVSSHALAQGRVAGATFSVGVFTNLTSDHLDFHGDVESYKAAKTLLFERLSASERPAVAVLNEDDPAWRALRSSPRKPKRVVSYSASGAAGADFRAEEVRKEPSGSSFRLCYPGGSFSVTIPLLGSFNVENALGAFAAAYALGISPRESVKALEDFPGVPGRMERFRSRDGVIAVVDYAHTEDALQKTLQALRELAPKRLGVVVGCGGDRDPTKRPRMAAVACSLADRVLFTADNPRTESIDHIFADMAKGVPAGSRPAWIPDRFSAIRAALWEAESGDLICIAGKGHETTQEVQGVFHPFDDRSIVSKILAERG